LCSSLLRIVTPVLQTLIALTIGVFLRLLFLRKMPLAICYYLAHVIDVFLVVFTSFFLWILLQDGNNFTA
jgi:hypothetical protein